MNRTLVTLLALAWGARLAAQEPMRNPHGTLDESCATCHSPEAWKPARVSAAFDHAKKGFVLTGAHQRAACTACHKTLDFQGTSRDCVGCHEDAHRGELGADCARCHTPRSFLDHTGMVRAHQTTRFPLSGAHLTADCESCHPPAPQGRMTFLNQPTECQDCHMPAYRSAQNPDHVAVGMPTDCVTCHTPVAWANARFDHARTGFALVGAHLTLACSACHGTGLSGVLASSCVGCHQQDYDGTTDPNHSAVQFPTDCASCHTTSTWSGASFDHSKTGFPLTGAHTSQSCGACHVGSTPPPSTCVACHQNDYNGTADPNHAAAQFPTDCAACHSTATWSGAKFDHDGPYFPIYSGAHRGRWQTCSDCHTNASDFRVFDCLGCHAKNSTDSHHTGVANYQYDSGACYRCHPRGTSG